jgi:D-glycero-alpha-D-manno-heptose-7-phosphate kinase
VQIEVFPYDGQHERIVIFAENYGERYALHPEVPGWDRHPLLEATIELMQVPDDVCFQVTIYSEAPAGASTGTSAAVTVALVGALDHLMPGRMTPHEIARTAHRVETDMLKRQSGIQDQLCSAYGGINFIEMDRYPHAAVSQIFVPNTIWWELERRLALIYLGKTHDSSKVHEKVIAELEDAGPECRQLEDLRHTAERSRDALYAGDFAALGQAMADNTAAQERLNPALLSEDARRVIAIAQEYGALGWKMNGAGGEGGSVTLLCGAESHQKRAMIREIEQENPLFRNIPVYLSRFGLRTWEQINHD